MQVQHAVLLAATGRGRHGDPVVLQFAGLIRDILHPPSQNTPSNPVFLQRQRQEVFCKIRAALPRLQKYADLINYMVPLDPDALRRECKKGREVTACSLSKMTLRI
jgi:hypothetical protein